MPLAENYPTRRILSGRLLFVLLLLLTGSQVGHTYQITGKIVLDESWDPKIYLSALHSLDDRSTASEDFIINVAPVRADGSFTIKGDNLPAQPSLYRLHVCKKGDPPATLFIGGNEENHVHFIMQEDSDLYFSSEELFRRSQLVGHPANEVLQELQAMVHAAKKTPAVNSRVNREYKTQRFRKDLANFIDTCSFTIPGLLAMHHYGLHDPGHDVYNRFKKRLVFWESENGSSPYLTATVRELNFNRYQGNGNAPFPWIYLIAGLFVLAGMLFVLLFYRRSAMPVKGRQRTSLSVQERKVLKMLRSGKSNKEIAEALHVEVSTVKSHVSRIYSKLGVRSRKEVMADL